MMNTDRITCREMVERRRNIGVLGRGTDSYRTDLGRCSRKPLDGDVLCAQHRAKHDERQRVLELRRQTRSS